MRPPRKIFMVEDHCPVRDLNVSLTVTEVSLPSGHATAVSKKTCSNVEACLREYQDRGGIVAIEGCLLR